MVSILLMFLVAISLVVLIISAGLGRRGELIINMTLILTITIVISYSLTFI